MGSGFSVRTSVVGGIAFVALVSQLISGTGQYFDRMAMGREQIRQINEAVLQPVSELAARGISGGNQMVLTDPAANALYKASAVRYLSIEGMSEGAPKTAFTDAMPPQKIAYEYVAPGEPVARLKEIALSPSASGLLEAEHLYVIKAKLPEVKNGGQLVAVFSAEQLASLPAQTLKEVLPLAMGVICLAVALAWFIGSRIALPITRLAGRVERVSRSLDLTDRIEISTHEIAFNREAGDTALAFNGLLEKLHDTLSVVLSNVTRVNEAVEKVSSLSGTVAERSEQQNASSTQMAAAMERSTATLAEIASNADYLDRSSRASSTLSANGTSIIRKAGDEMGLIARTVQEGAVSIEELGRQSNEISAIVQVIREIADQTNLLALNAAIEAARAGEQGRGFAVVADEVRKLAERTSQSTTQIIGMINAVQGSSKTAVGVMEDTVKRVDQGVLLASQAGSAITEISGSNEDVINGVKAISEALHQQNIAYQEIQRHVERVALMTKENSHAASDTASAASELEGLSRAMSEAVSKFRL